MYRVITRKMYRVTTKAIRINNRTLQLKMNRSFATMYCMQCEQTSHGTGCTAQGICGKWPETSNVQDLLLYANNGIAQYIDNMGEKNLSKPLKEKVRNHINESMFATLTNVNFSDDRITEYIHETVDLREQIKNEFRAFSPEIQPFEEDTDSPCNYFPSSTTADSDAMQADAIGLAGLSKTKNKIGDANCFGLRECAQYGLKGMMAYFAHAESMQNDGKNDIYTEAERDQIYKICFGTMNGLCSNSKDLNYWLGMNMSIGESNIKVMELLDKSHTTLFGTPAPISVPAVPVPGKCVLLSGHDILDVRRFLDVIKEKKLDINVYTHGELLPAHSYPELQKYGNLKGHFGNAWQMQFRDFKQFPGPIVMTSNCLMPPRTRYRDRLYTTHGVGYQDIKHIDPSNENDIIQVLQHASSLPGFDDETIGQVKQTKPHLTGFGHGALLSHADVVVNAIKSGDLQHIFVIGGCDGTEKARSYFEDLASITPDNSVILTLGCGKFRLHGLELGELGNSGLPRIMDVGQCNDSYSAVVVAMKLAEALETDVHSLPLHFAISWFEQKAVAVFLSLLHLGIKNIRLGPALPAFLTPDVRQYLFDNLGVRQINADDEEADMEQMLSEVGKS